MAMMERAASFIPDGQNHRLLRDAFGRFATGVTIVTAQSADGPVAITANSFTSVSLDPPLVLWTIDKSSRRFEHFVKATHFAIHVLAANQEDLCWRIARDPFGLRDVEFAISDTELPILKDCLACFECGLDSHISGGDHTIMLARILRVRFEKDRAALGFFAGQIGRFMEQDA